MKKEVDEVEQIMLDRISKLKPDPDFLSMEEEAIRNEMKGVVLDRKYRSRPIRIGREYEIPRIPMAEATPEKLDELDDTPCPLYRKREPALGCLKCFYFSACHFVRSGNAEESEALEQLYDLNPEDPDSVVYQDEQLERAMDLLQLALHSLMFLRDAGKSRYLAETHQVRAFVNARSEAIAAGVNHLLRYDWKRRGK